MLSRLGVASPRLQWAASNIYQRAKDSHGKGYSFAELRAAAVYASCRLFGLPKTLRDVSRVSGVKGAVVARNYRRMLVDDDLRVPIPDPASFVPPIARRAGLELDVERRALGILSSLKEAHVGEGRSPMVVAAAVLYQAYSELHPTEPSLREPGQPTQKSIADAIGVNEVSIRNQLRWIRLLLDRKK